LVLIRCIDLFDNTEASMLFFYVLQALFSVPRDGRLSKREAVSVRHRQKRRLLTLFSVRH